MARGKRGTHGGANALAFPEYTAGSVVDGKYRLVRLLGEGGMGTVWAAHSRPLDVAVALKLLRVDTAHADSAERLIREARVMARLADPGIVRVFDVGRSEQGEPYIVMELLVGASLRQVLDGARLDAVRAVRLLLPIVRALECAHRAGVVHRDVKPDNIVLAQGARGDLQPKLLDFGAAKLVQGADHLTRVGTVVGSPLYMSPEQARGEAVDHRTDLWSVCAVLYEAISGQPPFGADNTNALLHAINTQEVRALPAGQTLDAELWSIVHRGLTKDRDARWQHARDLMLDLAGWLRAQGATEDITGTALQGRGLGRYSSLPAAGDSSRVDVLDSKHRATGVLGADFAAELAGAPELPVRWSRPRRPRSFPRLLAGRHHSPRFWSAIAVVLLLAMLAGIGWRRASSAHEPRATPASHAPEQSAPPPSALPAPLPASTTNAAPTNMSESEASVQASPAAPAPGAAPQAAARSSQGAAPRAPARSAPSKAKSTPRPAKTPAARAPKAAFKDPFD